MTLEQTLTVYKELSESNCRDEFHDLVLTAIRYARIRVDWLLADPGRQASIDSSRTRAHESFIDACDVMSRNMDLKGEDNRWRATIGTHRKDIGDFACRLHCVLGLMAR